MIVKKTIVRALSSTALGRHLLAQRRRRALLTQASRRGITVAAGAGTRTITDGSKTMILKSAQSVRIENVVEHWAVLAGAIEESRLDFTRPGWFTLSDTKRRVFLNSFTESEEIARQSIEHLDIQPGMKVLDLGANIGLVSLILAERVGQSGRVVAVEGDPENFKCLENNVSGNPNITPLFCAVWAHDGHVSFDAQGTTMSSVKDGPGYQTVPCSKLETLSAAYGPFDAVKMDIEGGEFAVIAAAKGFIDSGKAQWAIEIHGGKPMAERLAPLFSGYTITIDESGHLPMMFCFPNRKPLLT